jgi:hypothetical protein
MKRLLLVVWVVPLALAVLFWFRPPRGDDSYHHTMNAVEQARAWMEGALMPRYHRGWNGGTGTFAPTIYAPISQSVQGGLACLVGDGQRAVGISLAAALLVTAAALVGLSRERIAVLVLVTPYLLADALTRSTTTELWALAGAATVLPLAMPPAELTRWRGLGLAAGVLLVAGCQVGMLLQLGWLLGTAWAVNLLGGWKSNGDKVTEIGRRLAGVAAWGFAGLFAAGVLWLPAVVDAHNLAITELVSGPLDWRNNFLPAGSELGVLLTATAVSLAVIALILIVRRAETESLPAAAAVLVGVALSTPLSEPLWHLPKMEDLQFPWRVLGPTTLVAILALASLRGWWRAVGIVILVLPLVLLPVRIGSSDDSVPTMSTPEELALIAHRQWNLIPILPTTAGFYAPGYDRLASLDQLGGQQARLTVVERDVGGGIWRITNGAPGRVLLPLQWWPEWRVEAGGLELPYTNQWGLVAIELEEGTLEVRASLAGSRSRTEGLWISLMGLVALLALAMWWGPERGRAPTSPGEA